MGELTFNQRLDLLIKQYKLSRAKHPGPEQVGKNFFYNRMKKYLIDLKIPRGYVLYSWKHTGAQQLARNKDIPLVFIMSQLRHSSLDEMIPYLNGLLAQGNDEIRKNAPEL